MVDHLSKYAHFIELHHPCKAPTVALGFVNDIVRLHRFPVSIISDRDKIFMSKFWFELFRLQGTSLCCSTNYHPQTDGQSEIVNQAPETYLRCFVNGQPRQWSKWLNWAEYCYNTSHIHLFVLFMALYGCPPPSFYCCGHNTTPMDSLEIELRVRDAILDDLKLYLLRAQHRMKKWADGKRRDCSFNIRDWVFVKLQPYLEQSLVRCPCDKLATRFYGPYEVLEKVGEVAYKLLLREGCKIHLIFHVSQLKAAMRAPFNPTPIPAQLSQSLEFFIEPEEVLNTRQDPNHDLDSTEVLIKWKGLPNLEATWEHYQGIASIFVDF